MTVTHTPQVLADGQLPLVKGTIVTFTNRTYFTIRGRNLSGVQVTVYFYLNPSGTSRAVFPPIVLEDDEAFAIGKDKPEILEAGDLLEGYATGEVDFIVQSVVRT